VDEVINFTDLYRKQYGGWKVKHFYSFYRRNHRGRRSYTCKEQAPESQAGAKGSWAWEAPEMPGAGSPVRNDATSGWEHS